MTYSKTAVVDTRGARSTLRSLDRRTGNPRHFTLSREDTDLVSERRGASSRLGFEALLPYMRWPGRVLEASEKPQHAILAFIADQIDVQVKAFDDYARRDETRRAHLADFMRQFGYTAFDRNHFA